MGNQHEEQILCKCIAADGSTYSYHEFGLSQFGATLITITQIG